MAPKRRGEGEAARLEVPPYLLSRAASEPPVPQVAAVDVFRFTQLTDAGPSSLEPPPEERSTPSAQPAAPVQIAVGPDGRLVISSQDTAALDLLEELFAQLAPPRKDFKIFTLKYASAFWIRVNSQDYFKEELEDTGQRRRNFYYFDYAPPGKTIPDLACSIYACQGQLACSRFFPIPPPHFRPPPVLHRWTEVCKPSGPP